MWPTGGAYARGGQIVARRQPLLVEDPPQLSVEIALAPSGARSSAIFGDEITAVAMADRL